MADPYASERRDPTIPHCSALHLKFDGRELTLIGGRAPHAYPAVSGKRINGKFDYSASAQKQVNSGPIPAGVFWISPVERWDNAWYKRGSRVSWGNHRITIHPFTTTETHKRGGFFIHGGTTPGSIGCIDLATQMDTFISDLETEMKGTPTDCQIHLKVEYSK